MHILPDVGGSVFLVERQVLLLFSGLHISRYYIFQLSPLYSSATVAMSQYLYSFLVSYAGINQTGQP